MSQTRGLTWRILNAYHSRISSLIDYISDISESDTPAHPDFAHPLEEESNQALRKYLLRDSDPTAYHDLMTAGVVAESSVRHDKCKLKIAEPSSTMTDIIDRAQARLFARSRKPANVLTAGYRSAELRSETGKAGAGGARQGVTNFFVNTLVTALQASEWCLLLKRVGDAILLHLLIDTSVYVALPNDCFCQIIGPPLIYTIPPVSLPYMKHTEEKRECGESLALNSRKRKVPDDNESSGRPSKRRKRNNGVFHVLEPKKATAKATTKNCSAVRIPISRVTMFYGRAYRRSKSVAVHLGLPTGHILHRMSTRGWRLARGLERGDGKNDLRPGDRNGALEARHLSKYVFPLQYELANVFSIHAARLRNELFTRFEFVNREQEIDSKSCCKTPPRLKMTLPLLAQLYLRHTKCGYKALLNKICPSKLKPAHKDASADSSAILELISEDTSKELQTQMHHTMSTGTSISTPGLHPNSSRSRNPTGSHSSEAQSQVKLRPKFAEFTCDYAEVYLQKNCRTVLHHVKQIISGRRNEGTTLHNVMQGISTSECDWLISTRRLSHNLKQSEAEMLKRRELLQEFIFWYFDQFLLPLLRTTFYITESSAYRNRVLYFRQDDWDILCQPLLDRLATTMFQRITQDEAEDLLQHRKLGYSFVRLLPKDSGVRPIVNLRRKKRAASGNALDQSQSINQILSAAFRILDYEKEKQAEKLGASVFGPNETYLRLKQFKSKITDAHGKLPKLYFVKVDVKACFDTIDQSRLLGILKELMTEDVYMIQKFGRITPSSGRIQRKFIRNAIPDYEHSHFLVYAKQLAALLRHAILVDQVVYPFAFRDEIIELLEDHITTNIVKIGKDYYRQRVGIPQGSVLSSLLCSFFYGNLERNELHFVTDPSKTNVLLRLIDDYLFITTDMRDARRFLEVMNQGHPEYGCFIAREKTLTNFDHRVGDISQLSLSTVMHPDQKLFPWCGYLINTEDLSIMADYSRFHDNYLTDSLTIERCRRPNSAFLQKMLQTSKAKTHAIFTDTVHNLPRGVRINVYQAFVLTAMKMHAYIRAARHDAGGLAFLPRTSSSISASDELTAAEVPSSKGGKAKRCGFKERSMLRGEGAFLLKSIRQCIHYTYASIRSRAAGKVARQGGWTCDLTKDEVIWLGTHAFHSVLSIKRVAYTPMGVLGVLHADLAHPRYFRTSRRLAGIARESLQSMLRDIRF